MTANLQENPHWPQSKKRSRIKGLIKLAQSQSSSNQPDRGTLGNLQTSPEEMWGRLLGYRFKPQARRDQAVKALIR